MITFVEQALAQRQFNIYNALVVQYKFVLPENQRQLDKLKEEKRKLLLDNSGFAKLKLYFPVIGIQVQINKLQAWVTDKESIIPSWREKRDNSEAILDQYNGEHKRD